jgi:type IV pilus assembly protein PilQ
MLTAAAATVRLVGVSAQANVVTIEASEPVAYTVNRPDPLTLVVDLRDVNVADATSRVQPQSAVSSVRLEQAKAPDGVAVARVRMTLVRPAEYTVKSARNTIRVELASAVPSAAAPKIPTPAPVPVAAAANASTEATAIERVRSSRSGSTTVVTISANGKLSPTGVTESRDLPRRLILDFPNVSTRAAAQTPGDGDLVRRVRVAVNSQTPLVTRVVMELGDGATYALQRGTVGTRELSVVVTGGAEAATAATATPAASTPRANQPSAPVRARATESRNPAPVGTGSGKSEDAAFAALGAETITMAQAIANGAALAPKDSPAADPIAALKTVPHPSAAASPPAKVQAPAIAMRATAQAAQDPAPAPQPAPAQPTPGMQGTSQQISVGPEKKYTGHPISMDFQGVDLRSVLRTFAEISGLNMVIDPDVQGTVDIVLTDVPWDQALEVILRGNQLDYTVDGTIVRIAKIDTLRREQDAKVQLAQSAANAGALAVRTYTLSYAKADQAAPLIRSAVLSQRGNVQIDTRTNTLIITDLAARLDTVNQLLATIDRAEPQVEIEARIITTTRDFARALGVQWGFNGRANSTIGNTTGLAFPNNGSLGGRIGGVQGPGNSDPRATDLENAGTAVNLGVGAASSAIGLALGSINGAFNLDVALTALERSGKGRILSTPRVTTQNNVEAEITQGVQIPVQTAANETVTVTFKDAALTLRVTPQITASNTVIMQITLENASPGTIVDTGAGLVPSIDTQRAITRVQVNDGMTTVMGGIFVSREQTTKDRTPVLHRIPFLGWLFKRDSQVDESRELLIFITPRIQKG